MMPTSKEVPTLFNPDVLTQPVISFFYEISDGTIEAPKHTHRKGQLIVAMHGSVICETDKGWWMVPPHCAVWIPGGILHSNSTDHNGVLYFVYIEPETANLPTNCCTLSITPLLRELIQRLAELPQNYQADDSAGRLAAVLLDELVLMKVEQLHLPISDDPRLRKIAKLLTANPADRRKVADWAQKLAMSERTFTRFIVRETGMTFGRWRQQLHIIIALQQLSAGVRVQRVADNLGYESVNAFITMFKKVLGKPPARYFSNLDEPTGR